MIERAAGIIPIKFEGNETLVYLVRLRSGDHVSFPKGKIDEGEKELEAAKRELREETGLEVQRILLERSFYEQYSFERRGEKVAKEVVFFVAEVKGNPKIDESEILEGKWVKKAHVERELSYEASKKTYLEVMKALEAKYGRSK